MGRNVFIVDVNYCNGCHNCQVACKDEHCGIAWTPYAEKQPMTGQFWCEVEEKVRGTVPKTRINYIPHFDAQDDAIADYASEVLQKREDGLIVIDPEKAKGRKDLAEKFSGIYWNAELEIPQGCTGCAHLVDDGEIPHCVDSCATGALQFGDETQFAEEIAHATQLTPQSHVYYLNYPKRFVAGEVIDPDADEVLIDAHVELLLENKVIASTTTDELGDYWFKQVEPALYQVRIVGPDGYRERTFDADATNEDMNVGTAKLYKITSWTPVP